MKNKGFQVSMGMLVLVLILVVTAVLVLYFFQHAYSSTSAGIGQVEGTIEENVEGAAGVVAPESVGEWADPFSGEEET